MARNPGRSIGLLALALLAGAGVSWTIRSLQEAQRLPPVRDLLLERTIALLVGAGIALVLFLVFRGIGTALRLRGQVEALPSLRAFEVLVGAFLAVLVLIAAAGGIGTAFVGAGLVGVALTLALQRPILSIAGWAVVRFSRLFREGDRIEMDGIVGDVVDIGLFTTRVWEIGSTRSPLSWGGSVAPLRPTGRVVLLSNATFLEKPVANATADVPLIFDEFAVTVAYEGDWRLARRLLLEAGRAIIDPQTHALAAERYAALIRNVPTLADIPREPVVIMSLEQSWIELRLRYLIDTHERSKVRTRLAEAWQEASALHPEALPNVYPRSQPMAVGADGRPAHP